jgi:hypothetical protein
MSWQQLIAAVQADMAALYASAAGAGTVTSIGLAPGSGDIVVGAPNPVTTNGNIPVDLSAAVKTALADALTALQSISIATGTGLTGGPLGAAGSTVALSSSSITDLGLAATALQPVTGLGGSYTYASLTLNASGQITAVGSGAAPPAAANPTGTVGLAAVNGIATTFMRSDAAPPLSVSIAPTMTGQWTFTPTADPAIVINLHAAGDFGLVLNGTAAGQSALQLNVNGAAEGYVGIAGAAGQLITGSGANDLAIRTQGGAIDFSTNSGGSIQAQITTAGAFKSVSSLGLNGVTPPAQVTGFGTPTGAGVVANFSGTAATTAQIQETIAQILTILKAYGMIGA